MQHHINGHKETVQFFNYKKALCRHCLLMIYRERDVPNCVLLIHAATINLLTDLGGGQHRPKAAWGAFHACRSLQQQMHLSDIGKTEQEGAAQPPSGILLGRNGGHMAQC